MVRVHPLAAHVRTDHLDVSPDGHLLDPLVNEGGGRLAQVAVLGGEVHNLGHAVLSVVLPGLDDLRAGVVFEERRLDVSEGVCEGFRVLKGSRTTLSAL